MNRARSIADSPNRRRAGGAAGELFGHGLFFDEYLQGSVERAEGNNSP